MLASSKEGLYERVREKRSLEVHQGQARVLRHRSRVRVVVAGRRWGKTVTSGVALIKEARIRKRLIWYVAPSYRMAKQIMWPWLMENMPKEWIAHMNETFMTIRLVNGTEIALKGADKPDALRGVGLHFLVIDEAQDIREETWSQVLRPTLASTGGKALIIGTPKGFNWFHKLYLRGQDENLVRKGMWKSWQYPTITSPYIPASEIEQAKEDMDEKSFRQEFEASFETQSGRVYYPFDRSVHVQPCAFNDKLPIWVGMDFNLDPMSAVIMQKGLDGIMRAVDEIMIYNSNTEEVAEEIERRYWRYVPRLTVYPDPAGATGSTKSAGKSDIDILMDKGFRRIKYRRKHPSVVDRINAVNRMLRDAKGQVRMFVDPKCTNLIESFEKVLYKEGTREIDKKPSIEHITDAIGYPIEYEFPVRKHKTAGLSI